DHLGPAAARPRPQRLDLPPQSRPTGDRVFRRARPAARRGARLLRSAALARGPSAAPESVEPRQPLDRRLGPAAVSRLAHEPRGLDTDIGSPCRGRLLLPKQTVREANLTTRIFARRDVLKIAFAGAASVPATCAFRGGFAQAAEMPKYNPKAQFELKVSEVDFRRTSAGRMLKARIYQPNGTGPFPTVLDLHGGAWNGKNRLAEEPMDRALAASGLLVVAIDMTLAPEAPYPACVQDANYAVRWLKTNAATWNGDVSKIGVYGSSSGGHVAELLAMRPPDPRYNSIPPSPAPPPHAPVACGAPRSPLSNTSAPYENAERRRNEGMVKNNRVFFSPWETIHESNPQEILERQEKVTLVPFLIMQGALDDNVLPEMQEKFARTYRAAGGDC